MGRVGRARREVNEEGLVGRERLLLRDPGHRLVGHVLHEVVALFGRLFRLDRRSSLVERRIPLVRLAADESVEVFEAAAARGPGIERPDRTRLPYRHFMAFAELRRRIAVELERARQRRDRIGKHRAVARCAGGDLGDAAHPRGMMVASGEERLARRGTQGGRVKPVVFQSARRQPLRVRRRAGAAESARGAESGIVDENDHDVRRALGRAELFDGRELRVGIFRVVGDETGPVRARNRQMGTVLAVVVAHDIGLVMRGVAFVPLGSPAFVGR